MTVTKRSKRNRSKIGINLQNPQKFSNIPSVKQFNLWVQSTYADIDISGDLNICIVDEPQSQYLNFTYRQKNKPTNILAFPYNSNEIIGDLAICAPVVAAEAKSQGKSVEAHWAHLVIHGGLHCIGYDHIENSDRLRMEAKEIQIMTELGYPNPYEEEHVHE